MASILELYCKIGRGSWLRLRKDSEAPKDRAVVKTKEQESGSSSSRSIVVVGLNFHQVQKRHYAKMEIMHAPRPTW